MIAYRDCGPDDAAMLAALARETFAEAFGHLYQADDLALFYEQWKTAAAFERLLRIPGLKCRVAEDAGHPVGYAIFTRDHSLDYEGQAAELKQLYVRASHHGCGIAQALMDWTIDQTKAVGAREIVLSVYSGNPRGQAFYAKYGFAKHSDTTFTVGKQVDAEYLFVKQL